MKVLVCGSREWRDRHAIAQRLEQLPPDTIIIQGGASGADYYAAEVARELGFGVVTFPAQWKKHGKKAGPFRNQLMADITKPDLVLAFPIIGSSRGTWHMVRVARHKRIPVEVYETAENRLQLMIDRLANI